MSPDYPPQTIADSPWKRGRIVAVAGGVPSPDLASSSRIDRGRSGPFPFFSSPPPRAKNIDSRGRRSKGTRESKGSFVRISSLIKQDPTVLINKRKVYRWSQQTFRHTFSQKKLRLKGIAIARVRGMSHVHQRLRGKRDRSSLSHGFFLSIRVSVAADIRRKNRVEEEIYRRPSGAATLSRPAIFEPVLTSISSLINLIN